MKPFEPFGPYKALVFHPCYHYDPGSVEDIAQEMQAAREEKGLAGYWDYTAQAMALNISKGIWDIPAEEVTNLDHTKKPTALEEYLKRRYQTS